MSNLVPYSNPGKPSTAVARSTSREVAKIEHRTLVGLANARSNEMILAEQMDAIDRLAAGAVAGQATINKVRHAVAADPIENDELRIFTEHARLGKAALLDRYIRDVAR